MSIDVRPARATDTSDLVELRAIMFAAMGVPDTGREWRDEAARWFAARIDDPDHHLVVVTDAATVVACAMGAIRDAAPSPSVPQGRDVLISNVCTRPEARGRGHAAAAFDAVMAWARATGVGRAELLATEAGQGLYLRHGFRVSEHPVMRRDLGPS